MGKYKLLKRVSGVFMAVVMSAAFLPVSSLISSASVSDDKTASALDTQNTNLLQRAKDYFSSRQIKATDFTEKEEDPNEVIRVLVELKDEAVAYSVGSVEYDEETHDIEENMLADQAVIIEKVEKLTGNKVISQSAYLFNGFSIEMKRSQMSEVEKIKGVKSVNRVSQFQPLMSDAVDLTSVSQMWQEDTGYTGAGIAIAVVDSGVNWEHPDMQLKDESKVKFTAAQMKEKIEMLGYGRYFSPKVPFGFSYGGMKDGDVDNDYITHGLAVSGIAAATGASGEGGVKGVAPDAQIFAMQSYTYSGTVASSDLILRAIEDSVKLGADVINISIGVSTGFYGGDTTFMERGLAFAEENGIICCVAAGNNALSTSATTENFTNDFGLIDSGAVSSPSTYKDVLSVASANNAKTKEEIVMAKDSSWGPTPSLEIKPEITAPGANINTVNNDDTYEVRSGTSMAAPYVSGASALVLQALKKAIAEKTINLNDISLNAFVKQSLMNTADPIKDKNHTGSYYSVRQQGAGLVDPLGASKNRVLATYNGEASIALKEISGTTTFEILLTNYGTSEVKYTLSDSEVFTDAIDTDNTAYVSKIEGAKISFEQKTVTVAAGGTATVNGTLTLGSARKDHFVEGYISLKAENGNVDLGMPLLAFYGNWAEAQRIVDKPFYDAENIISKFYQEYYATHPQYDSNNELISWNYTAYLNTTLLTSRQDYLGLRTESDFDNFDTKNFAFSPNGDGSKDDVWPVITLLRNAAKLSYEVTDANGKVLRTIYNTSNVSKLLGTNLTASYLYSREIGTNFESNNYSGPACAWDGMIFNTKTGEYELAPEGQYYISVKAQMPGSNYVEETKLPIILDVTAPVLSVTKVTYSAALNNRLTVEFTVNEKNTLADFVLYVNGEQYGFTRADCTDLGNGKYSAIINEVTSYLSTSMNEISVAANDFAGNTGICYFYNMYSFEDGENVMFTNFSAKGDLPTLSDYTSNRTVISGDEQGGNARYEYSDVKSTLRGIVKTDEVASLTVNGIPADINSGTGVFTVTFPVELGINKITVKALGASGNTVYTLEKDVLVDLAGPEIDAWITDEAHTGVWDTSHTLVSFFNYGGNMFYGGNKFATNLDENKAVPIAIKIKDDTEISTISLAWAEGRVNADQSMALQYVLYMGAPVSYYPDAASFLRTQDIQPNELTQDGMVYVDIPFFAMDSKNWGASGDSKIPTDYYQIWFQINVTDIAGNVSHYLLTIETGVTAEDTAKAPNHAGENLLEEVSAAARANFSDLTPGWSNFTLPAGGIVIPAELVDDDGYVTYTGTYGSTLAEVWYNGSKLTTTTNNGVTTATFRQKLEPGWNSLVYMTIATFLGYSGDPDETVWTIPVYYMPEGYGFELNLSNNEIKDGATIYTNSDTFEFSGEAISHVGHITLNINGNQLLTKDRNTYGSLPEGETLNRTFSFKVDLSDGYAFVKLLASDAATEMEMNFLIVKGSKPASVDNFAKKVSAISEANTLSARFNAIKEAVDYYNSLSEVEKAQVKADYKTLKTEIETYNADAEKANDARSSAFRSGMDIMS